MSANSLVGKVIAITAASNGIGKATAELLANKGALLVLNGLREEPLVQFTNELKKEHGDKYTYIAGDVSQKSTILKMVNLAVERFDHLDAFISCAGAMHLSMLDQVNENEWKSIFDTNINGLSNAIASALPIFQQQKNGHFITVASTSAFKTVPLQTMYSASKHAVRAIMDGLRQEVAPEIRSTIISPGVTATEGAKNSMTKIQDSKARQQMLDFVDTLGMDPAAVARCIVFALEQPPEINIGEIVVRSSAHK